MAGIVNGSIAACRRTTYCLRFLRLPYYPLDLRQSLATLHHRRRTHNSSSGSENGRDQQHQLKGCGGSEVKAAPPDPQDVPGEKRTESPHEVRPGLPLEAQPNRTPLEVNPPPPHPHTIICSSDSALGDKAAKGTDTKGSEPKSDNSLPKESPASPITEFIDDPKYQPPSPKKSDLQSKKSNIHSIESELNSRTTIVNEFKEGARNQDLSSIKSTQGTSPNNSKSEVTQGKTDSKDAPKSQASHSTKAEPKSQDCLPTEKKDESKPQKCQATSDILQADPLTSPSVSKPLSSNADSLPKAGDPFGSSGCQSSSFRLLGEGKIAGQEAESETLVYSSAKHGYGSQYGQMISKDPELKRSETIKEDVVDSEIIDQWVDKFKRHYMAEKAAFGLDNENEVSPSSDRQCPEIPISAPNAEKPVGTTVQKNNAGVPKNSDAADAPGVPSEAGFSTTMTKKISPGQTLPLKIVAKDEAPTAFRQSRKPLPPSELASNKDAPFDAAGASTKPLEFILKQHPAAEAKVIAASASKSGEILSMVQDKTPRETTEDIVAMFTKDCSEDLTKTEEGKVQEFFETFDGLSRSQDPETTVLESTKSSQADVLVMSASGSEKTGDASLKLTKFEKSIVAKEDAESPKNDSSDNELTIQGGNKDEVLLKKSQKDESFEKSGFDLAEKASSFIKSANEPDATKKVTTQKEKSAADEAISILKERYQKDKSKTETTSILPGDLCDSVSNEVSGPSPVETMMPEVDESENLNPGLEAPEVRAGSRRDETKDKSKTETTSMLPGDLYDPVSNEVSGPSPVETMMTEVDESEDLNPGLEAPEVRAGSRRDETRAAPQAKDETRAPPQAKDEPKVAPPQAKDESKVAPPQAKDESKSKEDEKAPGAEKPVRKEKPQLDDGELSMKLLDKVSAGMPSASTTEIPGSATAAQAPAEKSIIKKLFDKILGRSGKGEGKRHMSTYTVRRQLSASCTFPVPPRLVSELRNNIQEEKRELKPDHEAPVNMQPPTLELFAKDTKDLTEIRGGSPACKEPKKSPRDLLREKQQSKNIKILGGSEECAKKMKRLKELTKDSDDDCDHFSRSLSEFLRQLRDIITVDGSTSSDDEH